MPRRSRRSGRPSTTSPRISKSPNASGADRRATGRARGGGLHAFLVGRRPHSVVRAARVPRGLGARAGDRAHPLRPLPGVQRGADGEGALARRLAGQLRGALARARARRADARGSETDCRSTRSPGSRGTATCSPRCSRRRSPRSISSTASSSVEPAIVEAFEPRIEYALTTHVDHKTELQEQLARLGRSVSYTVLDVQGPPHDRSFTAAAMIDGEVAGTGSGRSKKDAEQAAAQEALAATTPKT